MAEFVEEKVQVMKWHGCRNYGSGGARTLKALFLVSIVVMERKFFG